VANKTDNDQTHGDEKGGEGKEVGQTIAEVHSDVAVQVEALRNYVDKPKDLKLNL
jgi:hypothetical protein